MQKLPITTPPSHPPATHRLHHQLHNPSTLRRCWTRCGRIWKPTWTLPCKSPKNNPYNIPWNTIIDPTHCRSSLQTFNSSSLVTAISFPASPSGTSQGRQTANLHPKKSSSSSGSLSCLQPTRATSFSFVSRSRELRDSQVSLPKPEGSQLRLPPGWSPLGHTHPPGSNRTRTVNFTDGPGSVAGMGHLGQAGRTCLLHYSWYPSFLACSANGSTQTCGPTLSRTTIITLETTHGIFILTSRPFRQTSKTCQIFLATTFTSHTSILGSNSNPERPYQGLA